MESSTSIRQHLLQAAQLLPAQGPITAFVFLNALQALEDLPFEEGLHRGHDLFGSETTLSEDRYRDKLKRGRILPADLEETLRTALNGNSETPVGPTGTRLDLRLAMLLHPVRSAPLPEIEWFLAETDALTRYPSMDELTVDRCVTETRQWAARERHGAHGDSFRSAWPELADSQNWPAGEWESFSLRVLWQVSQDGVRRVPSFQSRGPRLLTRHRDVLLAQSGHDVDRLVQEALIPFLAAFIDQGLATWELPHRESGLWQAFHSLYGDHSTGEPWLASLADELQRVAPDTPEKSLADSLALLGVPHDEAADYLTRELLALRGWAGMIWQGEDRGDRIGRPWPAGSLLEYMAVRLVLVRIAVAHLTDRPAHSSLADLRSRSKTAECEPIPVEDRAFEIFQIAQLRGWSAAAVVELTPAKWAELIVEIESFGSAQRRHAFHLAFERRFRIQALDAITIHTRDNAPQRVSDPLFQSVYCIDTREESFRRHLEESCPRAETFGAAGFFGVAMYFKGVADAHFLALCPIVVRPKVWVTEEVVYSLVEAASRSAKSRRRLAQASHQIHVRSRSMAAGALLTASFGVLATIPLVARVLFPQTTSRLREAVASVVAPPPVTRLRLERLTADPGPNGDAIGYSLDEMAGIGERILSETGLRTGFARLVCFFGHGSFCLNNPHKSCYDCGACSGSAGSPNARALAAMLNDSRVRRLLDLRGIAIPETTTFLGGLHNTATDEITFYDLDLLPRTHRPDFEAARDALEKACELNAQERCRRFYSAPLEISPSEAKSHVASRAEDLAQTRPEFGNASNAMCVVGRRSRTRGLFLDRRSFLVSYDAALDDDESTILGRILGAVVIVCSGINLQYYFSYVDPAGWGAGTKLPHNITSLLGVMDGAASDLRSGLPWQGVEIHEPVRLLFVIEATPEAIAKIMQRNAAVGNILRNGWVQLALLDPCTSQVRLYQAGEYVPYTPSQTVLPQAKQSHDWYSGSRDHLGFAQIAGSG